MSTFRLEPAPYCNRCWRVIRNKFYIGTISDHNYFYQKKIYKIKDNKIILINSFWAQANFRKDVNGRMIKNCHPMRINDKILFLPKLEHFLLDILWKDYYV